MRLARECEAARRFRIRDIGMRFWHLSAGNMTLGTWGSSGESVVLMEDIVAARVRDSSGKWYGFMTWGRIVDRIDDSWIQQLAHAHASKCGIKEVVDVRICDSLSDVAACQYFYEGLFHFANAGIPFGSSYEIWRQDRLSEFKQGTIDVYFLGQERESGLT
jgi:hypothetical protein